MFLALRETSWRAETHRTEQAPFPEARLSIFFLCCSHSDGAGFVCFHAQPVDVDAFKRLLRKKMTGPQMTDPTALALGPMSAG